MQAKHGTATGTVRSGDGILRGCVLRGGSAASTLTLYDNTTASGDVLGEIAAAIGGSGVVTGLNVAFTTGLHAVLSGAGASFTLYID
jgi:hypothetical protein